MARGNQVVRQWRLLQLVSRPGGVTVDAAAREFGCSVRTVWRDLKNLQDSGFPLYDDPASDGRQTVWRVEGSFQQRLPFPISLDEIVALILSEKLLAPAGASPLGPAIASFLGKVRALLTPQALELLERMATRVGARAFGAKLQQDAAEHLPLIQRALREGRALRLRYFSMSRSAETDRRVDPYHLTHWNGGLYLVGYCHLRHDVRIFAVERVRTAQLLDERFTVPTEFEIETYLAGAWGMVRGNLIVVRARFSRAVAPYVRERLWHPSQQVRVLPDSRIELSLRVADTIEVRRWLLGFGAEAEVLEPASLRKAIRTEAQRLAGRLDGVRATEPAAPALRKPVARAASVSRTRKPLARAVPAKLSRAHRRRPA